MKQPAGTFKRDCNRWKNGDCPEDSEKVCRFYAHCAIQNNHPIPFGNSKEDYQNE